MEFEKTIDLPSCGLLDGSKKQIQIGSMDMRAEKVIYTHQLPTQKLLRILELCTDADPKDLRKFPFADLVYAFVRIRVLSAGSSLYDFRVRCQMPECDKPFNVQADFDEMEVKFLEEMDDGSPLDPFSVSLPVSGKEVVLRYLRAKDNLDLEKDKKKAETRGTLSDQRFLLETLAKRTVSIDGESKSEAVYLQFFEQMKTRDGWAIRDKIEERDFGLMMTIDGNCPSCGDFGEYVVRLDASFFRPQPGGQEATA